MRVKQITVSWLWYIDAIWKNSDSCFHVSWMNVTVPLAELHLKYQPVNF
jgi:hypothetical protein